MTFVIAACVLFVCIDAASVLNDYSVGSDACSQPPEILDPNIPEDENVLLQSKTSLSSEVEFNLKLNGSQVKLVEPPPIAFDDEAGVAFLGTSSVCGAEEDFVPTTCLGDSLVKEQARAVAHMTFHKKHHHQKKCCTGWLVKKADAFKGALMLTTGHCSAPTAIFKFDDVKSCPYGKHVRRPSKKVCGGILITSERAKDEQAIYELDKTCHHAATLTPILLDIGRPDLYEGIYIIGHPKCRPQALSHQKLNANGHPCEVRSFKTRKGSSRVSYYCDTKGGNSGSPLFSARTGHAFAFHSQGGCGHKRWGNTNYGCLLENSGIVAAFNRFGIWFENRKNTNLFKYDQFVSMSDCLNYARQTSFTRKSLAECQVLCVGSLTCVGIKHSTSRQICIVNYRSTSTSSACEGDAKYLFRLALAADAGDAGELG